jgi:hypothetical protein
MQQILTLVRLYMGFLSRRITRLRLHHGTASGACRNFPSDKFFQLMGSGKLLISLGDGDQAVRHAPMVQWLFAPLALWVRAIPPRSTWT